MRATIVVSTAILLCYKMTDARPYVNLLFKNSDSNGDEVLNRDELKAFVLNALEDPIDDDNFENDITEISSFFNDKANIMDVENLCNVFGSLLKEDVFLPSTLQTYVKQDILESLYKECDALETKTAEGNWSYSQFGSFVERAFRNIDLKTDARKVETWFYILKKFKLLEFKNIVEFCVDNAELLQKEYLDYEAALAAGKA